MANTEEKKTQSRRMVLSAPITEKGLMVGVNTVTGLITKATDSGSIRVIGLNEATGVTGDSLDIRSGIFLMDNDTTHPMVKADIGQHANCYVIDEHTVGHTSTNGCVAGDVVDVVTEGVWLFVGHDSGT
jgi:hypothetical protein